MSSSFCAQRRGVAKIKTPLRLGSFAPLREQKKYVSPSAAEACPAELRGFFFSRKEKETPRNLTALLFLPACRHAGTWYFVQSFFLLFSRKEGEPRRSRPLCDLAPLRLCVNKKKNVSQRKGDAKKSNRSFVLACLPPCRYLVLRTILFSSFFAQRRGAAKIKTPLRLGAFAPLREQKKECLAKKRRRQEI